MLRQSLPVRVKLSLTTIRHPKTVSIEHGMCPMDETLDHRIRERAYQIWAMNGCPEGQADQHWLAAEREILQRPIIALVAQRSTVKTPGRSSARNRVQKQA